jgi:membrane fusion protein, heavy metal efflux system
MKTIKISFLYLVTLCTLLACQKIEEKIKNDNEFLQLKEDQLKSMEITLEPIMQRSIQPIVFATGKVALLPNSQASISSNIGGKVERVHVVEGDHVKEGQSLFTITSMAFIELQQNYLTARNDMEFLKQEHERLAILRKGDVASLSEFQSVQNKYANARSNEESLREKLKLLGIDMQLLSNTEHPNVVNKLEIKSPMSGSVFKVFASPGKNIESNTPLAEVLNMGKIYADVDVYEQDLDQVQEGQAVEMEFINKSIAKTIGIVKHIVTSIDPESRAVKVHVDFSVPKGATVLPEMAVKVKITGKKTKATKPTMPLSALLQEGELFYVYYAIPKGKKWEFHKSKVSIGENNGTLTEVNMPEQIPADAQVVTQNVYLVDAESKKRGN